jgi:hypothetical protein
MMEADIARLRGTLTPKGWLEPPGVGGMPGIGLWSTSRWMGKGFKVEAGGGHLNNVT